RNLGRGFLPRKALICSASSCFRRFMSVSNACCAEGAPYSLAAPPFIEGPEVGPALLCEGFSLFVPPAGDLGVMPGREDVGDAATLELCRSCVLGKFEQAFYEAFLPGRV